MIVINNISDRQNEIELLRIQFCARHLYDVASILNKFAWICCLFTTIVLPFFSGAIGDLKYVIVAIINVVALVIGFLSSRFVKLGAAYKMCFDYKLFQFKERETYNGFSAGYLRQVVAKIIKRYHKRYNEAVSHNGTDKPNGVKDWYVEISKDMRKEEAIKKCQEQNGFFDKEIMKIAWWVFVGLVSIFIIVFVILNQANSVGATSICVFSSSALVIMIITEIYRYVKVYSTYYFIDSVKDEPNISSLTRQKIIDERRNLNLITPKIIYKIKSFNLHTLLKAEDQIEI